MYLGYFVCFFSFPTVIGLLAFFIELDWAQSEKGDEQNKVTLHGIISVTVFT